MIFHLKPQLIELIDYSILQDIYDGRHKTIIEPPICQDNQAMII